MFVDSNGLPEVERKLGYFLFLSLPAELRDNVYEKIFEGGGIEVGRATRCKSKVLVCRHDDFKVGSGRCQCGGHLYEFSRPSDGLNLALSCRQVLQETKDYLVCKDAVTFSLGTKISGLPNQQIVHNFVRHLSPALIAKLYKRGMRILYQATSYPSIAQDKELVDHPSMAFVTHILRWNPNMEHCIIDTDINIGFEHFEKLLWSPHLSRHSSEEDIQVLVAQGEGEEEAERWEHTLNESKMKSDPGKWKCTLDAWRWRGEKCMGTSRVYLRPRIRCVKSLPSPEEK